MLRVLVCGHRLIKDVELVRAKLDLLLGPRLPEVTVLHRGRQGPDRAAEGWAHSRGVPWRAVFDAQQALTQADAVVVFAVRCWWHAETAEAELAVEAKEQGKSVRVVVVALK